MAHGHIFGFIVRHVRQMRAQGASAVEIVSYLKGRTVRDETYLLYDYLSEAFLQRKLLFMNALPPGPIDDKREQVATALMDRERATWEGQRFPELKQIRDYFAFLQFAKEQRLIVAVCGWRPGDEAYRLHGVYDADSGEPAWSGRRGENLRAILNRRLGSEMVQCGPHDNWEFRNDRNVAGLLWGPQAPVIEFNDRHEITNYLRWEDLAQNPPYDRHWPRLYPHHPVGR